MMGLKYVVRMTTRGGRSIEGKSLWFEAQG